MDSIPLLSKKLTSLLRYGDEKVKVLRAIPPIEDKNLVRGQFLGYRDENGVAKDSQTETFAVVKSPST